MNKQASNIDTSTITASDDIKIYIYGCDKI